MAIYDADGTQLFHAYDADGTELQKAYDADGSLIYTAEPQRLKVMQYNVGGWYTGTGQSVPFAYDAQYYALQNGMIAEHDPDILCINEYRDQFTTGGRTALSVLSQYFSYHEARQGTEAYMGHAIYSKYPIISYTENKYSNDTARYYGLAEINVNGTVLNVICTHLSTDYTKRPTQSDILLAYAQTLDNVIVCGDFNLHCRSKDYIYVISNTAEWECYRPWINAGYHLVNNDDEFGFIDTFYNATSEVEGARGWWSLDNIIVSPNITINDVYADETKKNSPITSDPNWLIDHMPLIAEISI